ncbi:DnaJ domain-containing protein [Pseudohalioglobus lutimaris]|uniref:J domain-containing protein n=1 Tax=Pseudohalioglobus lutimaris TaxID=1737061 RepID=A0A2N5WWJ5_9GAMM|nr:DnaJ domain-containing protein [Pseudohalioglobus lutimaris]PLW66612.1 hypothetical protein C0039_20715 [Pseudohalioglobus lutimaris]
MKNTLNYYQVLHVAPDAPREIIRASYRALMQKLRMHPDLGGNSDTAVLINEAYSTLTDPSQRAAYDQARHRTAMKPAVHRESLDAQSALPGSTADLHCVFCKAPRLLEPGQKPTGGDCENCQSPLPGSRHSIRAEDGRRDISRVPKDQILAYWTHWPQKRPFLARSSDISLSGMKFNCDQPLPMNQVLKIESRTLCATARVVRCYADGTRWGVGVQFLSLGFDNSCGSFIAERV